MLGGLLRGAQSTGFAAQIPNELSANVEDLLGLLVDDVPFVVAHLYGGFEVEAEAHVGGAIFEQEIAELGDLVADVLGFDCELGSIGGTRKDAILVGRRKGLVAQPSRLDAGFEEGGYVHDDGDRLGLVMGE